MDKKSVKILHFYFFVIVSILLFRWSCRNGQSLGEAFTNVRVGQGFAYFPAVSLSVHENVRANFGSTPLHYSLPGYHPLQAPPTVDVIRSRLLLGCFERLVPIMASCCVPKVKNISSAMVCQVLHTLVFCSTMYIFLS